MKILHITPEINFALNFVKPICDEQLKLGFEVTIITTQAYYSPSKDYNYSYLLKSKSGKLKIEFLNLRLRKLQLSLISSYVSFVKMLSYKDYDIIIFHTTLDSTFPLIFAKLFSKAKRIYFNHGVPSLGYKGLIKYVLEIIEKANVNFSDSVFTIGPSMKDALITISPKSQPHLVYPGSACGIKLLTDHYEELKELRIIARKKLGFEPKLKIVLYVGRPVKRKGIFDLIDSWKSLDYNNDYLLLMAGPRQEDFNDNINLPSNIKLLGYISNVEDYYLSADILCMPSYHEGLGYTYLEAAAAGCVSICSNIPGPTDFIKNNLTGIAVEKGSIKEISLAIQQLLHNKELNYKISKNAFELVLKYDTKKIAPVLVYNINKC